MNAKRWRKELADAKKREQAWLDKGRKLWDIYRGEQSARNSFNVLYSNTDILAPSLLSSTPVPDVRRRFRDEDPLGKAVSAVMERALSVVCDNEDTERAWKDDVLDACIPGRGVARVRYVAQIEQVPSEPEPAEDDEDDDEDGGGSIEEQMGCEHVAIEHVNWEDFRHGYGRTWKEVPWVAFRAKLTKDEVAEKFGDEVAERLKYATAEEDEKEQQEATGEAKFTELWEVWDKAKRRVFFVAEGEDKCLYPLDNPDGEPPIDFEGFFPNAEPIRLIADSSSLVPTPVYQTYEKQAEELNRISGRINRLINQMKVRGIYPGQLGEIASMLEGEDGTLIPVQDAQSWAALGGGLDKAISWMPIDMIVAALIRLYEAREACKQTIYEISGISDIQRGATKATETLGAQQIKANFAGIRMSRMRGEVARYIRDTLRLVAEVIGEKFAPETLAEMTGLQFPTAQQKQQAMMQLQQMQAQGHEPDPQMVQALQVPTWDDIMRVMRDDHLRGYRIDIETDSTVAASIESDMQGLTEVLGGITQLVQGLGPAVQSGAMPAEVLKSIILAVVRRAKLGMAVEDAMEKIAQPKPQADPRAEIEQAKMQAQQQAQQAEQQLEQARLQMEQQRMQMDAQAEQAKAQADIAIAQATAQAEIQIMREKAAAQMEIERARAEAKIEIERFKAGQAAQ